MNKYVAKIVITNLMKPDEVWDYELTQVEFDVKCNRPPRHEPPALVPGDTSFYDLNIRGIVTRLEPYSELIKLAGGERMSEEDKFPPCEHKRLVGKVNAIECVDCLSVWILDSVSYQYRIEKDWGRKYRTMDAEMSGQPEHIKINKDKKVK